MTSLLLSALFGFVFQQPALAQTPSATLQPVKVLSLHNGQQLLIELNGQGRTLRLACLQAPRSVQQPYANDAAQALADRVSRGDHATFELRSRDVYGRLVGRLIVEGRDLGADLVRRGAVFAWDGFLGRCDDLKYSDLQQLSRQERRGVWSIPGGLQRPWDVMETHPGEEP